MILVAKKTVGAAGKETDPGGKGRENQGHGIEADPKDWKRADQNTPRQRNGYREGNQRGAPAKELPDRRAPLIKAKEAEKKDGRENATDDEARDRADVLGQRMNVTRYSQVNVQPGIEGDQKYHR